MTRRVAVMIPGGIAPPGRGSTHLRVLQAVMIPAGIATGRRRRGSRRPCRRHDPWRDRNRIESNRMTLLPTGSRHDPWRDRNPPREVPTASGRWAVMIPGGIATDERRPGQRLV